MSSMKLIGTFLFVSLVYVPVQAAEIGSASDTIYDNVSSATDVGSGCELHQSLVMTEGTHLKWNTATICNGVSIAQDTTVFAEPAIKTLVYLLGKAADLATYADSQGISPDQELFVWDRHIVVRLRSIDGKPVVELFNSALSGGLASPLRIAISSSPEDSVSARSLARDIHTSMLAFSR